MRWLILLCPMVAVAFSQTTAERRVDAWQVPQQIKDCVASLAPLANSSLQVNFDINPYYLRGDFDGDGQMDLAIAMRSSADDAKLGIGICRGAKAPVLLGAISKGKRFSDDPADSVASVGWAVITGNVLMQVLKKNNPARHQATGIRTKLDRVRGEMIYMPYEDAEGLIFFVDGHFHWYTINSTMLPQDQPQ